MNAGTTKTTQIQVKHKINQIMKIYYSPEYSGIVYVKPADGTTVMMDTVVVNTIGLVNMLELRLGIHFDDDTELVRMAHYYAAVSQYMAAHPRNVLSESFKTAGLSTAKAMLSWRDELRNAGWDLKWGKIEDRLAVLIGVESIFHAGQDLSDRLRAVTQQLSGLNCQDMTIVLPVALSLLKPLPKALVEALVKQGARIQEVTPASDAGNNLSKVRELIAKKQAGQITLDEGDDSIQIWKFPDERLACEYLTYMGLEDVDVWINADNKSMDNWLKLMGKPATGSVTADCTPQLTQLFVTGLGLFAEPLNLNTLIEWLNMPLHPISGFVRSRLAATIVDKGGYRNDDCRKWIDECIDDPDLAKVFLPPTQPRTSIATADVRTFVTRLSSWASQQAHQQAGKAGGGQWVEQLMAVAGMCDAFGELLKTVGGSTIDYKTIDSWMTAIYQPGSYTNAEAVKGCRTVVDSPAKMATVAGRTIWVGVDGDASQGQECSFLYPSEKEALASHMQPWDEAAENQYHEQMLMTPLRLTDRQLILVVRERIGGELVQKHPLIVRLEQQIANIDKFVQYPQVGIGDRHSVSQVTHAELPAELQFSNASQLKWPDHLSPTPVETLVEHPFDYLMERLLNINYDGKAKMSDVKTTQGNVAHAVIQALFAPQDGQTCATPAEIETRIKTGYDAAYLEALGAKGGLLQLTENRLEEQLLHEQLRSCLNVLLGILKENDLKVTGCEHKVQSMMNIGLPQAFDDAGNLLNRDMTGYIDMTLEDSAGLPVVFDFKWTHWDGYEKKLSENRSVQLEFYRLMLSQEKLKQVDRVAYFLMPEARLYSPEVFQGQNCIHVTPSNGNNIVAQLMNSIQYRKSQLNAGLVETKYKYEDLQYVKDTPARDLFPLKKTDDKKLTVQTQEANPFTKYGLFNNQDR